MNCNRCSASVPTDSHFCLKCGSQITVGGSNQQIPVNQPQQTINQSQQMTIEDNTVLYQIKPTFVTFYQLVGKIIGSAIAAIFISMPIAGIVTMQRESQGYYHTFDATSDLVLFILPIFIVVTMVLTIIGMVITKTRFANYQYNFYRTKLVYIDGFFNKMEKEVRYKHIRQHYWFQPFLRRFFNLSCIQITNDTGFGGIRVTDLANGKQHYEQIKKILDANPDR